MGSTSPRRGGNGPGCLSYSRLGAAGQARSRRTTRISSAAAKIAGLERRDQIADEHAARTGLKSASLRAYCETRSTTSSATKSVAVSERFYDKAARAGLCPERAFASSTTTGATARRAIARLASVERGRGDRLSAGEGERLVARCVALRSGAGRGRSAGRKHPARRRDVHRGPERELHQRLHDELPVLCVLSAYRARRGVGSFARPAREEAQRSRDAGGVRILLQGGLHPELRIEWYEDLFRWIKRDFGLGLHALSPEEILHIGRLEGLTVRGVLERLTPRVSIASREAEQRFSSTACDERSRKRSAPATNGLGSCGSLTTWACVRAQR